MAFDFSQLRPKNQTVQQSVMNASLQRMNDYNKVVPFIEAFLCYIDDNGYLQPIKDNINTPMPRLVLELYDYVLKEIYILPYDKAKIKEFPECEVKSGLEKLETEWDNTLTRIKDTSINKENKDFVKACIALKILFQHPYRKEGENATRKDRALLEIENQPISAQDLSDIELIVREVNQLQLPKFLQEEQCKTFGDLYNTLDHLWISIMGTGTSDNSDLLGVYERKKAEKCVKLFLDMLKECSEGSQDRFRSLVRTTYIHELFHAYFDIFSGTDLHKPSIKEVEEPLVEYAMLLTLEEHDYSSQICAEARKDVNSKKKNENTYHYAIGSSSKLTPEVLLRYKYLKFLIEYAEFKKAVESYESLAKDQKNIDKCAKELVALLEDPELLKKAQDKAPTSTTSGNANQ